MDQENLIDKWNNAQQNKIGSIGELGIGISEPHTLVLNKPNHGSSLLSLHSRNIDEKL